MLYVELPMLGCTTLSFYRPGVSGHIPIRNALQLFCFAWAPNKLESPYCKGRSRLLYPLQYGDFGLFCTIARRNNCRTDRFRNVQVNPSGR